jgi:hypothetical protein
MTWKTRPAKYEEPGARRPRRSRAVYRRSARAESRASRERSSSGTRDVFMQGWWHRVWERLPAEVHDLGDRGRRRVAVRDHPDVPHQEQRADDRERAAVHAARAGGARHLHRRGLLQLPLADDPPDLAETKRYGEYSKPGEFVYDHPFQWGSRRIGPDLAREGGKQSHDWHVRHFENPRQLIAGLDHARRTAPALEGRSTLSRSRAASTPWPCWACPTASPAGGTFDLPRERRLLGAVSTLSSVEFSRRSRYSIRSRTRWQERQIAEDTKLFGSTRRSRRR